MMLVFDIRGEEKKHADIHSAHFCQFTCISAEQAPNRSMSTLLYVPMLITLVSRSWNKEVNRRFH